MARDLGQETLPCESPRLLRVEEALSAPLWPLARPRSAAACLQATGMARSPPPGGWVSDYEEDGESRPGRLERARLQG